MTILKVTLLCLGVWNCCTGANLQPADYLFISTHRNPTQIVSDDRSAYVLTEGGVLLYDYRRRQWQDNIAPGMGIKSIAYFPDKSQLRLLTEKGNVLEYSPTFRRLTPSYDPYVETAGGTSPTELNGLSLGGDFAYLGDDGVRDRYNRRALVRVSKVFDYDQLWLLTAGHGAFLGSMRRKEAASLWFGLYDSSVTAVYGSGKNLWFGSAKSSGALVRSKLDLSEWKIYPSQQDYEFPEGNIRDIVNWKDFLWLATSKGVVRQDIASGRFRFFRQMLGSTNLAVNRLFVHEDQLFAGTEKGVAYLISPEGEFRSAEFPSAIAPMIGDFATKNKDLWVASNVGLFVRRPDGWKTLSVVSKEDVPEATGIPMSSVGYHDSSLYFSDATRLFEKNRGVKPKAIFALSQIFRIAFDGNMLYAGHPGGVRAYNLKTRLSVDFRLEDGIPGHKVQCFWVYDGLLWIGTDLGVLRLKLRPYLPS